MCTNIGKYERVTRVVLGLLLFFIGYNYVSGIAVGIIYFFAVILILTGIVGWCGLYSALGFSSKGHVIDKITREDIEKAVKESSVSNSSVVENLVTGEPIVIKKKAAKKSAKKASKKVAKKAVKKIAKKKAVKKDDLVKIEGIGPAIQKHLYNEGINSYADLAKTQVLKLKTILEKNSLSFHDPSTWPEQAKLANGKKWAQLKKLQEELNAGKRK